MTPLQWVLYGKRTAVTGAVTSACALAALLVVSRYETGHAFAALNGSGQLVNGDEALRARDASLRHTLPALLIQHASAHWWAAAQEHPVLVRHVPGPALRACALTLLAAFLDYGLLPKRLSPGYEGQLSLRGIALVFAAVGAGLALGSRIQQLPARIPHRTVRRLLASSTGRALA